MPEFGLLAEGHEGHEGPEGHESQPMGPVGRPMGHLPGPLGLRLANPVTGDEVRRMLWGSMLE